MAPPPLLLPGDAALTATVSCWLADPPTSSSTVNLTVKLPTAVGETAKLLFVVLLVKLLTPAPAVINVQLYPTME